MGKKKSSKSFKKSPPKTTPEVRGLILLCTALLLLLSLISFSFDPQVSNVLGLLGKSSGFFLHATFGLSSYIFCIFIGWIGWRQLFTKPINDLFLKILYVTTLIFSISMLLAIVEIKLPTVADSIRSIFYYTHKQRRVNYHLGGAPFYYLYHDLPYLNLERLMNWLGALCLFATTALASIIFLFKISPQRIFSQLSNLKFNFKLNLKPAFTTTTPKEAVIATVEESDLSRFVKLRSKTTEYEPKIEEPELPAVVKSKPKTTPKVEMHVPQEFILSSQPSGLNLTGYQIPPVTLLTNAKKIDSTHLKTNLKKQAEVLEETLLSFGIEAKVGQINCGPTITSFEVHPAVGVKVQKIKTLENDIALNMEAKSIRIIAPIPGKAAVGIEVPNLAPQEVGFKEMLAAYQQGSQKFKIPILLGKAVNGDYVMSDLTKWPHCIIAGATGSGKSVCINTIVMSVVLNAKPDEIRLLMVDPKKVELSSYTNLPHMLAPVITEPRDACNALNWLVKEMEKRYEILKLLGVRNIEAFNNRKIDLELEKTFEVQIPEKLPYLVGIIDELADLMMVSSSDIETPIARIAQMARAVGIHLILATQRPSREVITGLIKANFPTRISFKVASRVNSQIILDETGAESLLGNGDMLFLPPGSSHLVRAQGAYIRDEDIASVIKFITEQAPPQYLIQSFNQGSFASDFGMDEGKEEPEDPLFSEAVDIVLSTGNASTTFLQRKLKIGYARAASLIDQLEAKNIVGPSEGAKPRKILVPLRRAANNGSPNELDDEEL